MTAFIDDTMRKTNDPEFTVSEVFSSVSAVIVGDIVGIYKDVTYCDTGYVCRKCFYCHTS